MLPDSLLSLRRDTDGHELAVESASVLDHTHVHDLRGGEARGDRGELGFARGSEHDGVRALVRRARFAGGVHALGGEESYREISSDDHIVGDGIFVRRYVSRFSVAGWTWV